MFSVDHPGFEQRIKCPEIRGQSLGGRLPLGWRWEKMVASVRAVAMQRKVSDVFWKERRDLV